MPPLPPFHVTLQLIKPKIIGILSQQFFTIMAEKTNITSQISNRAAAAAAPAGISTNRQVGEEDHPQNSIMMTQICIPGE